MTGYALKYMGPAEFIPEIIRAFKAENANAVVLSDADCELMRAAQIRAADRDPLEDIGNIFHKIAKSLDAERNLAGEIKGSGI